jgi:hypothetical protein
MIVKTFKIDIYNWDVTYLEIENNDNAVDVAQRIKELGFLDAISDGHVLKKIEKNPLDGGFHVVVESEMKSLIIIFESSSKQERINSICHEKRHLEDTIGYICHLECGEAMAYIAGYIGEKLCIDIPT